MYKELTGNRLEAIKSAIEICDMIIDMQTTEVQDIFFRQEDSVVSEGEDSESTVFIDVDTIIPQLDKLNHNLDVLKESRIHLFEKFEEIIDEQEENEEE